MLDLSQIHTQVSVRSESDKFCFGLPGPWGDLRDRRLQLLLCPLSVECVTKGFRISCDGQGTLLVVQPCCSPKPLDRSVPWSDKPKVRGTKLYELSSTVTAAYFLARCKDFPKSSFSSLCISSWRRNLPIWWVCPLSTLTGLDFMTRVL